MYVRSVLLLVNLFLFSMLVFGQEQRSLTQAEQIVLDTPEVIKLEFAPLNQRGRGDVLEKMSGPFESGSTIIFNLMATNTSSIELWVRWWDRYAQNRPRLFRDNQELAYREDIADLIKMRDSKDWEPFSVRRMKFNPNEPRVLQPFILADWYGPLGPGRYELFTQHRFMQGGKWVNSTAIVFEVEEIKKPKQ